MQILIFTDFLFPRYLGGSARFASDLNEALKLNGHDVLEISRPSSGHYAGTKKKMHSLSIKKKLFAIFNCNYIFSHHSIFAIVPALFFSGKFIYFYHGPFAEEYYSKIRKRSIGYYLRNYIEQFVLWRSQRIIVLSQYMAKNVAGYQDKVVNLGPIQKVSDGTEKFTFRNSIKTKYKCLTVRRLTPRTGVSELLEILASSPNLELSVVGSGELKDSLSLKYHEKVKFYSNISDSELKNQYNNSDIVLLPSLNLEGFGLTILEAFAAGTPVLASKTSGGAYDFLRDLGIATFIDMHHDTQEEIYMKIVLTRAEFNDEKVKEKIQLSLQDSFYLVYARRLLDVL